MHSQYNDKFVPPEKSDLPTVNKIVSAFGKKVYTTDFDSLASQEMMRPPYKEKGTLTVTVQVNKQPKETYLYKRDKTIAFRLLSLLKMYEDH